MYTSFFGLNEKPFSITPDPRYLFMSERHTEALAHLIYGVRESGGFIQLTGEVGTGKTTLVRSLLQQIPDNADVAVILNPQISRNEFLSAICEELGVPLPQSANNIKTLTNALNEYLLNNHGQGKRTIVIVDEAQNLRIDVLEQVRLLTNLETTKQKLLQIILIGQPELREILSRNDMRQLAQRVTGRYHLEPLSRDETSAYIDHRLKVAGAVGPIFSNAAKQELYRLSLGVPRMINVIADRAMLGAFTQEIREISPSLLRQAAAEVFGKDSRLLSPWRRWRRLGVGIAAACVLTVTAMLIWTNWPAQLEQQTAVESVPDIELPVAPVVPVVPSTEKTPAALPAAATIEDAMPTANLAEVLATNRAATDTDNAFATLFGLWGLDYTHGNASACQQARNNGLYCLFQRGSLSQVKNMNHPVILTLRDQDSQQHQVVLSGLKNDIASIALADDVYEVDATELSDYWFGEYLLLWKPQINNLKQFVPGMRDADVRWLRQSLAEIQGKPLEPMDSDLFDQDLEARVRDYQRQRRLTIDGLVGYQTQIAINSDLSTLPGPRLVWAN
jgi:general secretion pathway protein A